MNIQLRASKIKFIGLENISQAYIELQVKDKKFFLA